MAEVTENTSHNRSQARQVIKRKRTKRQRPSSPFGVIDNYASEMSSEEEDEDMANCLIMLAQSVERRSSPIHQKTITDLAGVYECKTCNRTFQSFQALGGHRASHKKPKFNVENKISNSVMINIPPSLTEYSHELVEEQENKNNTNMIISNNVLKENFSSKGKVHECSICRSEFSSGQALGGHMRKHRPILHSRSGSIIDITAGNSDGNSVLSLDLNFPPPEVTSGDGQSEFQFTVSSSQQQQHLVLSAPALVDCYY